MKELLRNRYRVDHRLGAGGAGTVYAVEDLRKHDATGLLALKAMFASDSDETMLEALKREFRVLATLRHPCLARVHDFGRIPERSGLEGSRGRGGFFLTRDLVQGQDLKAHCRELAVAEICLVCARTALALDLLHRGGMVHGDLKPANVIVAANGQPHLIDFGLVHSEGQHGTGSGTLAYIAPEVLSGMPVDRRVDLYALGISLYQLLTGSLPLPEGTLTELIAWHMDGDPLRVSPHREVAPELDEVVSRLTEKNPDRRYPTTAEAALALLEAARCSGARRLPTPHDVAPFVPPPPGENLTDSLLELEQQVHGRLLQGRSGPALVTVEGEPGSGKSTLLQELAWRCQLAQIEVFRGEFCAGDPRAFGLWTDLLAQISGLAGIPHPMERLPEGSADRYVLYHKIVEYLERCATGAPLLLIFDDAQHAGEESLAAIRFICHTLGPRVPVMMVAAHRESPAAQEALGGMQTMGLRPLSEKDIERMVAHGSGRQDHALAARIHDHTGGNPQFVIDVLRRLGQHRWPANPDLHRLAPPRDLEQMYTSRWQELAGLQRRLLEALAVLGRPCSELLLQALLRVAGGPHGELMELALTRLEALDWIDRNSEGLWVFRRGPAAHTVYEGMPEEARQRLHRAAVKALDRVGQADQVERTRHALGARDLTLTLGGLDEALASLQGLGAHRDAIQLCSQAVALPRLEPAEQRRVRGILGELQLTVGDFEAAIQQLSLACEGAPKAERLGARVALAKAHRLAGDVARALEILQQLGRPAGGAARLFVLWETAAATMALDRHEEVLEVLEQALVLQQRHPIQSPVPAAELQGRLGYALAFVQRHERSTTLFEQALAETRAAGDGPGEVTILSHWAAAAMRQGDFSKASDLYGRMLEQARKTHDVPRVAAIQVNLALSYAWHGQYATSLELYAESLRLFEAMGAQQTATRTRCNLGQLQLRLGLQQQAQASLETAEEQSRAAGLRSIEAASVALLAQVQARRGRLEPARQGIDAAVAIYQELGMDRDSADALLDLAEMELAGGDTERARQALERAAEQLELEQVMDLQIRSAALGARLAARGGNEQHGAAAEALELALDAARGQDSPQLIWDCHLAAVELSDARGMPSQGTGHAVAGTRILAQMAAGLAPEIQAAFWQDESRRAMRQRAELQRSVEVESAMSINDGELESRKTTEMAPVGQAEGPLGPVLFGPGRTVGEAPGGGQIEERFYRLLEIYRQINSELDPERLLGLVMDTAVELTGAERGFLLLGPRPDQLEVEVARNLELEGDRGAYSRSIAERVFTSGQPVVTVSAHNDPRFKEYLSVHQLQLESVLCIPIHARNKVAGVLYMESRFQSGRFTPADQRLLMAFGDQVAIALTNARLLSDNIRKARELEKAKKEIEALAEERGRLLNKRTLQLEEARRDLAETRRKLQSSSGKFGMVGASAPMLKLFHLVERVAATNVPVLVEGDSGTGKEMVARAIHDNSERSKRRLVSVNCAAIPEGLLESELFGHVRGSFTGADRDRKGLFAVADGGTLFLDEIGDMPMRMQVDLLRALQEKTIRPVGGARDITVDVRIIAASNKPLAQLVPLGKFREDLYYRLNVVCLRLPPLRDRVEDIPLLVDHFLVRIAAQMKSEKLHLTREALRRLSDYSWPGNVRQLEHALLNAAVLADSNVLAGEDFTLEAPQIAVAEPASALPASGQDRRTREKQRILEALEACNWNKSQAARKMGMPRRTFYRRLQTYDIS